ncbi:MAG: response regulator [Acidobacteriota bacterium]
MAAGRGARRVLIVDDENSFLLSLSEGLARYAERFEVVTAENGDRALSILNSTSIDLVVTDLKMPVLNGFELLAHLRKEHPRTPAIVMTAFGGPELEAKLMKSGIIQYVEKPVDFQELADRILETLEGKSKGFLQGIPLSAFIQLVEVEKNTCIIGVRSGEKVGYLYFVKGNMVDAEAGDSVGEEAAYDILAWESVEIEMAPLPGRRKRRIDLALNHILLEAFRLKDEKALSIDTVQDTVVAAGDIDESDLLGLWADRRAIALLTKEAEMALEKHIQVLKEIKGYKAAGIMQFTGEMLAHHSDDPNIDLGLVGATFNDIFRTAHEASKKIGLDACREATIVTPKGIVIMRCSGTDAKVHFHVIAVLAADGNQALMKMQIDKLISPAMAELA